MSGRKPQNAPMSGDKGPQNPAGVEVGGLDQAFERIRSGRPRSEVSGNEGCTCLQCR